MWLATEGNRSSILCETHRNVSVRLACQPPNYAPACHSRSRPFSYQPLSPPPKHEKRQGLQARARQHRRAGTAIATGCGRSAASTRFSRIIGINRNSRKIGAVVVLEDMGQCRKNRKRNNLPVWVSAVRHSLCIHKTIGRHPLAWFPFLDDRTLGK